MRRTSIVLPDELHERLRQEAFHKKISMGRLIRTKLEGRTRARPRKSKTDPLLEVSGIGKGGNLARGIDEALYGNG